MIKCCVCGSKLIDNGHNVQPLKKEGRCCDKCFTKVVEYRVVVAMGKKRPTV